MEIAEDSRAALLRLGAPNRLCVDRMVRRPRIARERNSLSFRIVARSGSARASDQLECAGQVALANRVSLDLATGRFWQRSGPQQQDLTDVKLMIVRDRTANRVGDLAGVEALGPPHFGRDHQCCFCRDVDRERRGTSRANRGVGALDGELDILGKAVSTPNDDEVLEASVHEQEAVIQKPEVTRPQIRSVTGCESRTEHLLGQLGVTPVHGGDAVDAGADFADATRRTTNTFYRVDDQHLLLIVERPPARDERAGSTEARRLAPALIEACVIEAANRSPTTYAPRHDEAGLGEAVARRHR